MNTEKIISRLKERFPDQPVKFGAPPDPIAVFIAAHPDVGDIELFDDGDEVTLVAGKFSHSHFPGYGSKPPDEVEEKIAEHLTDFLKRLFADELVLWGSHSSSGGWYGRGDNPPERVRGPLYVWSGPLPGK